MDLRYVYNSQPVAEGERAVLYQAGRLYVRTSMLSAAVDDPDMQIVTYRLREVYDAARPEPVNHPPVAGDTSSTIDIGASQ